MFKVAIVYNLKGRKTKKYPLDYFSEFDSPETVEAIAEALRQSGHEVYLVQADKKLFDWLKSNPVDIVFNIAEGYSGSGREAQVPAILEFLGIPYTGSAMLSLSLSLDKAMAKQILSYNGIPTPKFQLVKSRDEVIRKDLTFPLIVKPNCEGSAKGIHTCNVVKEEQGLHEQISRIINLYRQDVIVEEFIEGKELTVGILGNQNHLILPILEIDFSQCRKKGEFFYSWEVKEYQGIDSRYPDPQFFCPARLFPEVEDEVKRVGLRAHSALSCLDISRVDIRLSKEQIPYVLEVNPLPGLDPRESNLMRMAQAANIKYSVLINMILENALKRHKLIAASKQEVLTKES